LQVVGGLVGVVGVVEVVVVILVVLAAVVAAQHKAKARHTRAQSFLALWR